MSEWADLFDSRKLSFSVAALWSHACVDIFQWHGVQRCWDHIRRKCTDKWTAANCTEVRFSSLNLFFFNFLHQAWYVTADIVCLWLKKIWTGFNELFQEMLIRNRWFSSGGGLDSRGSRLLPVINVCALQVVVCFHITTIFFFVRYLLQYQEPIPCEQLVTALCDIKQAYTQFGGKELTHPIVLHLETMSQCWWCVKYCLQIRW